MTKQQPCIYKITNVANGKVYIGQTIQGYNKRISQHKSELKNNKHRNDLLQNAWNKYGEKSFVFSLVVECDESQLDEIEISLIKEFKDKGLSYNLQEGGTTLKRHSYITKAKMSKLAKIRNSSPEQKKKMSEITKKLWAEGRFESKRKWWKEKRHRFIEINSGRIFDSIHDVVNELKVNKKSVYSACVGKSEFVFSSDGTPYLLAHYKEGKEYVKKQYIHPRANKVICITTGEIFNSLIDAQNSTGVSNSSIYNACIGKLKSAGKSQDGLKLRWAYYEDGKEYCRENFDDKSRHPNRLGVKLINTGEIFNSANEARKKYGIHVTCITNCCKGIQRYAGKLPDGTKLIWTFYNEHLSN